MACILCLEEDNKDNMIRLSCCKFKQNMHVDCLENYIKYNKFYENKYNTNEFNVDCPHCRLINEFKLIE
jgi:hypothetical protein